MEQREYERRAVRLGVVVSCPQFGLFRGQVEDLTPQGLFVRTQSVHMCLNAPVTVTFQPESQPGVCHNADGVVVRQSHDGFGIALTHVKSECQSALMTLFEGAPEISPSLLAG